MKKLNIAIVGLGNQMEDNLLPSILLSPYANIIGICDIDKEKINSIEKKHGISNSYESYKIMIDELNPDVVVVSSYPSIHFEVAKYAIKKKISVFVEKPPTRTTAQIKELIELAETNQVKTGVGMNFSYTNPHKVVSQILEKEDFGNLALLKVEHVSSKPQEPFWNYDSVIESFLLAQLIHPLDYILNLGKRKYNSINVFCSPYIKPFFMQLVINFENGVIGSLLSGTYSPRFQHKIEIVSDTSNSITITDLGNFEFTNSKLDVPYSLNNKKCAVTFYKSPLLSGYTNSGYQHEINSFFKHILNDEPFIHSFKDMLHVYEAMDDIHQQINTIIKQSITPKKVEIFDQ